MDIINRVKNILVTPKTEWFAINGENKNYSAILTTYLIPLALIPTIATLIGYGIVGYSILGVHVGGSFGYGLRQAIVAFISIIGGLYLSAWVISMLAPKFELTKDFNRAFQLVSYSYTPLAIAGILLILPSLAIISGLLGIYGLYLMYLGLGPIMNTLEDKKITFFIVCLLALIIVSTLVSVILNALLITPFSIY